MTDAVTVAALVDAEWSAAVRLLRQGGPAVWQRPTRLAGWSVEDLARHLHWGMTLEASALQHAVAHRAGRAEGLHARGPVEELPGALGTARAELVDALHALGRALDRGEHVPVLPMPYGDVPLGLGLQVLTMEAAVHRSDVAHALGGPAGDVLTPATHAACAAVLRAFWPTLAASAPLRPPPGTTVRLQGREVVVEQAFDGAGWGPATGPATLVLRGDDDAVLLHAYGRTAWDAAGLVAEGDVDLAPRLKELLPGP